MIRPLLSRLRARAIDLVLSEPVQTILARAAARAHGQGQEAALRDVAEILGIVFTTPDATLEAIERVRQGWVDHALRGGRQLADNAARIAELERTTQAAAERTARAERDLSRVLTACAASNVTVEIRSDAVVTVSITEQALDKPHPRWVPNPGPTCQVPNMHREPATVGQRLDREMFQKGKPHVHKPPVDWVGQGFVHCPDCPAPNRCANNMRCERP